MNISRKLISFINDQYNNYNRYDCIYLNFRNFLYSSDVKQHFPKTYKKYFKNSETLNECSNGYLMYDNGKQKVKLGKVIASVSKNDCGHKLSNNDLITIEKIVNSYKGWQKMLDDLKFVELNGSDISEIGYNTEHYYRKLGLLLGSLGNSCMNNRGVDYLKLYIINKKKISLLTLQDKEGKIHARALIWKIDNPKKTILMDRVYYINDYMVNMFQEYAKEKKWLYRDQCCKTIIDKEYKEFRNGVQLSIKLNTLRLKYYPYMDTLTWKGNRIFGSRTFAIKSIN